MKRTILVTVIALCLPSVSFSQVAALQQEFDAARCRHCWLEKCPGDDYKKTALYVQLHKQLSLLSDSQIEKLCHSPATGGHLEPFVRLTAMILLGEKKLSLSSLYTESLKDNHPSVRQAARKNLIQIAQAKDETVDFGPPPDSTQKDGIIAHRMWSRYFKEPWTDRLCENQYDRYYFDTYRQQYILRTELSPPLQSPLDVSPSLKAIRKND
jgi:hypothetical protein